MKIFRKKKKVGVALGGGAVLGAAHVGVLRALSESGIRISYIAGTSIGAFIAAFFAFGRSWKDIEEITGDLKWVDISGLSLSQFGLLSNKKLGEVIIDNIGEVDFENSDIPFAVVATDITSGEKVVIKEGPVAEAVMASACIPGIFIPVEKYGRLLVDGGIVENVPVSTLQDMGADYIIGVDLNAEHVNKRPENIIEVLLRSFDFTIKTASEIQTEEADLLIKPDLSSFNMVDVDQAEDLIEEGYSEAKKKLGEFK